VLMFFTVEPLSFDATGAALPTSAIVWSANCANSILLSVSEPSIPRLSVIVQVPALLVTV
jgi:hypothetical protein